MIQMTFDAGRTDRLSWFSAQWIMQHPYRDLGVEPLDVFSMEGYGSGKYSWFKDVLFATYGGIRGTVVARWIAG